MRKPFRALRHSALPRSISPVRCTPLLSVVNPLDTSHSRTISSPDPEAKLTPSEEWDTLLTDSMDAMDWVRNFTSNQAGTNFHHCWECR